MTIKDDKDNIIKTTHYTYDKLGNPITIATNNKQDNTVNTRHLDYTPDGQIKSIRDNDELIATYAYNHLRQRIAKTVYQKDNQTNQTKEETTQYLWDKGLLSAEIKHNPITNKPQITRRYIYLDIMPVAVLDYTYQDNKGKIHDKPIKTEVYSIHTDHLGTPKAITNQNQEVVWNIEMDTFGETKSIQAKTITDPNTNTQTVFEFNLRFAGQYFDQETGYHYNYHRYYDPKVGRYLTSDPIGLNGGSLNTYAYVDNEVWGNIDPWGLMRIYTFPNNGGGSGYVATYEFHFDTISVQSLDEANRVLGRLGRGADRIGQAVSAFYPKPYKSKKSSWSNPSDAFACGRFDNVLLTEYKKMFPNKPPANTMYRLKRDEAEKFINTMKINHTENMKIFYPETTKEILDTADDYAREHWYNKYLGISF